MAYGESSGHVTVDVKLVTAIRLGLEPIISQKQLWMLFNNNR